MNIMSSIRIYHVTLASLSLLAYITGEFGVIHSWLGYGVAVVIVFRLLWALGGNKQVGLSKFYPNFEGLNVTNAFTHPAISKALLLGIAISAIAVTATGIAIDGGKDIGLANVQIITNAYADSDEEEGEGRGDSFLGETHEFFANLMLLFVGAHISYLLLFKLPLAKFMLFIPKQVKDSNKKNDI
jgi:cytochrome b